MSSSLSESEIVRLMADKIAERVARKAIKKLQQMKYTMSGDDSVLKSIWDDLCVQVQYDESLFWESYDDTVHNIVESIVLDLPKHEQEAIWLQTDAGSDWSLEEPDVREIYPVINDHIVDYLTSDDLPLKFHPVAIRVSAVDTPSGTG